MVTEVSDYLKFEDFIDGVTVTRPGRRDHGPLERRRARRGTASTEPSDRKLVDSDGKAITFPNTDIPAAYAPSGAVLNMENGARVLVGDVLARLPQEKLEDPRHHGRSAARRGSVRGTPAKDPAILAEYSGTVSFGKETKGKRRLVITDEEGEEHEELIRSGAT